MATAKQEAWKRYYAKNKEKIKADAVARYHAKPLSEDNRQKRIEYMKAYYRQHKSSWQARRTKFKDKINSARRLKYQTDESTRQYYKDLAKRWKAANPHKALAQDLAIYGLKLEDYNAMLDKQGHRCAICGQKDKRRLNVDHCHGSKKVRGLLCNRCNFGLGNFRDDPAILRKAAAYLKGK